MTVNAKSLEQGTKNGFYRKSIDGFYVYDYFESDAIGATTWNIMLPDLHKYSKVEVIIEGEPSASAGSTPLYVRDNSGTSHNCFVQGWECWVNNMAFINRSQAKICDNYLNAYCSFYYDITFFPTGNSGNFVPFTSSSYGGDYSAGTATSQNWTGRVITSASNIKRLVLPTPALQDGFRYVVLTED